MATTTSELPDTQEVQRLVTRELEQWEVDLAPFYRKVNESWAQWNLQPVADDDPFLSRVQSSYPLYAVETILPRIVGQNPKMSYSPLDSDQDSLIATILSKVVSAQMKRMGFEVEVRDFVRQGLIAAYSVGKLYWERRTAKQATTNVEQHPFVAGEEHLGTFNVRVPGSEDVLVCNEPRFETVNVLDFAWPLYAHSINHARAVWQRRWLTMGELRRLEAEGIYQNIDEIGPADQNRWTTAYQPQFDAQGLVATPPWSDIADPDDPNAQIEIHERWENDRLTVIASRRICIRDCPNPFDHKRKPFVDFTPIPHPFQLQGQSIIDTIFDSNESLSTLMRQVSDAVTYSINPMFKSTEGIDWGNILMRPGGHIDVPDTEDIEPLVLPQVDLQGALAWKDSHLHDMQKYSGVFDVMGGISLGGTHTATGVSTVIQQATMRITEIVNQLDYRTMRPFGWMMEKYNAQYLDHDMVIDFSDDPAAQDAWAQLVEREKPTGIMAVLTGPFRSNGSQPPSANGYVSVKPTMIQAAGRLDPIPEVGQDDQAMKTQKRSDATQAAQAIAPILASQFNPIDMSAFANWMLQQYDVPPEVRKAIIKTPAAQEAAAANAAQDQLPSSSSSSGPSGDNAPTGAVVGAPGVAGGVGTSGMGPGR